MEAVHNEAFDMPLSRMEFYRSIPAGAALIETLNEMVQENILSDEDACSLLV